MINKQLRVRISSAIRIAAMIAAHVAYWFRVGSAELARRYMSLQARWPRLCLPAEYVLAAIREFRARLRSEAMNVALKANALESRQKALLDYGWGGGFISTEAERQEYWRAQAEASTLTYYLSGSSLLDIKATDSVLEAGCSAGGNMHALKLRFSGIRADGFDFREEAVALANSVVGDERSRFFVGDITDSAFMESLPTGGYDWVLLLSVLSHISRESVEHTRQLRRKALEELYRVCRKGLFVADIRPPDRDTVKLGLNNTYAEDITSYLAQLGGEVYALPRRIDSLVEFWGYITFKPPFTPRPFSSN